jgi:threonine/homoserine/homoserine lactone efflux protein
VLALTPGPPVVYIVARTVGPGRASGLALVLGVALGNRATQSARRWAWRRCSRCRPRAFTVVKWAGRGLPGVDWASGCGARAGAAATCRQSRPRCSRCAACSATARSSRAEPEDHPVLRGLPAAVPDAHGSPLAQTWRWAACSAPSPGCTDICYVLAAAWSGPRVARATRHAAWGHRVAGTSFIGLGVLTALGHKPGSH